MRKRFLLITSYLLLVTALCGCGYTTRSMITNKYHTIYITPFVNKTDITNEAYTGSQYRIYIPHLETDITNAVINKFLTDGNLKPVQEPNADLILKGELVDFHRDPLRYDNSKNVLEYRLSPVINMSLWDTKENKLLYQENNFTGDTTYYTSGTTAISESAAVNNALVDLARRVVERAVDQW
ncbi:MAG: LPS assembly lipoprotein LptE [Candidatus Omnitrophota bacterium]